MSIDAKTVKALRDKTGAGMMDCKKALLETDGNIDNAIDHLRKSGIAKAEKKGERTAKEGLIFSYIHHGGRLGVLVEINCETDFVAKTEGYSELAHSIAMQIAATNPMAIRREDIDQSVVEHEKNIFMDQVKDSGKPENIVEKIVEGRMEKFYAETCLLEQSFIKDPDKRVGDLVTQAVATLGENIVVNRFIRFAIGEDSSNGQPH
ncbi:MAG: translation elongation factor Ts [Candidatus Marinimicrobia bacterium]|jgi:elongation factor Ts|nr:translation elongation factor Ts [Candidatus Neomarinimicrobiota bacterium]MBT3947907.1 translation elongation factor Ts [Candidatus Neomarinimicrobiota bacterium]MBT4064172.1 translation elongation factor Ts [Candidatus Neomarinimicrobiota bacterium]MBT4307219.1 translation elongation factor Ts [Candidatus Neomarinimicrobiota bacterium]MBT4453395.1 translation elongation factor Ts [Candidatus Neomarinimicrobiota bacterium]|tara:strand:- start:188 stop:805 length:618 start_codon:yes stop_codon:yes gene_type:complete